jgi:hypothetical protein
MAKTKNIVCNLHRYKRIKIQHSHTVYKCQNPGCTHYVLPDLLEGRIAQCYNGCDEPFIITKAKARLAKPHCDKCTRITTYSKKEKKDTLDKLDNVLNTLGIE